MNRYCVLVYFFFLTLVSFSQIIIIGHPQLNNEALTNVSVTVKDGNTVLQNFNTKNNND